MLSSPELKHKLIKTVELLCPHYSLVLLKDKKASLYCWTKFQQRRATFSELMSLWSDQVNGVGIISGSVSGGVVCRDFDDGETSYKQWCVSHPLLSCYLPQDKTFKGYHIWFRTKTPVYKRCGNGEYIGDSGHYAVIPPSFHPQTVAGYQSIIPIGAEMPWIEDPIAAGLLPAGIAAPASFGYSETSKNPLTTPNNPLQPLIPKRIGQPHKRIGCPIRKRGRGYSEWISPSLVRIVDRNQPTQTGERNHYILSLVRDLRRWGGKLSECQLLTLFRLWWTEARKVVVTKDMEVSLHDFLYHYHKCPDQPKGLDVTRLLEGVDTTQTNLEILFTICQKLQAINGGRFFFLSGEQAGVVLNSTPTYGKKLLKRLCDEGRIIRFYKGNSHSGQASRYYIP